MLVLAGCGDSGLNPLRWFGGGQSAGPTTLTPEGGYVSADPRQPFPRVTGASWEPTANGRMLVVTGVPPTKGWWDPALIGEAPGRRVAPDADGSLRLVFVASPPLPGSPETAMAADPRADTITVARSFTNTELAGISQVVVSGAGQSLTLRP
ncbi:hypothetical protein GI374_03885 [Paracoccus sp. S-4012]|nr:hypothetical protein [Paracoccus sp. S-4012]